MHCANSTATRRAHKPALRVLSFTLQGELSEEEMGQLQQMLGDTELITVDRLKELGAPSTNASSSSGAPEEAKAAATA